MLKDINPIQMVAWEYVPDDLIDEIENKLRIWCDNVEIYFDRDQMHLGLNVPIEEGTTEILSWYEMQDLGLNGAINLVVLYPRHSQISLDWVTGRSPGLLVSQIKPEVSPEYRNTVHQRLELYGYQIPELRNDTVTVE